jgi:hypothetical protein
MNGKIREITGGLFMSEVDIRCQHCRARFDVKKSLRGGITNCPQCGKANEVPGGPEPLFWFLLSLGILAVLASAYGLGVVAGAPGALGALIVGAIIIAIALAAS